MTVLIFTATFGYGAYTTLVHFDQGGDELVIESSGQITVKSGGELEVESGGIVDVESGGYFKLAGTAVTSTAANLNSLSDLAAGIFNVDLVAARPDTSDFSGGEMWFSVTGDSIYIYTSAHTIVAFAGG